MRSLGILLLAFLLLAFESPFLKEASPSHYVPDLALLIVIYVGLTSTFQAGMGLALGIGLIKDAFTMTTPVGLYMEIFALVFLVAYRLSRRLALRGPLAVILISLVFSLGAALGELGLRLVFDRTFLLGTSGPGLILGSMLPQALATAPFAPVIFWLYDRLDGLTTRKRDSVYMQG